MKRLIFLTTILLVLAACNKPLVQYNSDFEGTWFSETQYNPDLQVFVSDELVFSGKTGSYQVDCKDTCSTNLCDCTAKLTGTAEVNQQRTIIRLNSQTKRTFQLDAEPYEQGGEWYMEIDGKKYKKQ
ncbi:MAG: membrane lipoprotein lipid attachment site-containing protein [Fluviicola sp.]